jgi:HAD superfamily hydrolase (TIGR01509 family)
VSDVQLVVFDLGRVLIRICNDWKHACELAGVCVPADLPSLDDEGMRRAHDATIELDSGRISLDEFAARVAPLRGIQPQDVVAAYDAFLLDPYPGAIELIDDLHAAGVQTACLSNTSDGHWRQMLDRAHRAFFPLDRLTFQFASHLIGACKPSDAIYQHVERTSNLSGDRIVFFDDLADNVAAAAWRGWRAHQIRIDADPIAQERAFLEQHGVL